MNGLLTEERVLQLIHFIRDQKVMLDSDLADMYGVPTKRLNEQVKRNLDRFPIDFMFQLNEEEWENLKSHFATSSWGGRRTYPYAFTEQGVSMLSSVLNNPQAIQINISKMRVYVKVREWTLNYGELALKIKELEKNSSEHHEHIAHIYQLRNCSDQILRIVL